MLRDVLCSLPGLGTWPCDEINYIWRYGNPGWPNDELPPGLATDRVRHYIESCFSQLSSARRLPIVVEKTCANSLRVPYVDAVFPTARYIFIHRDPVDCVVSASKRWGAPIDWSYTLSKARYVPYRDIPVYGMRFARNRLHQMTSGRGRVASWGPIFDGMSRELVRHTVTEVSAMQWLACVGQSAAAFAAIVPNRWATVSYEEFVRDPTGGLASLCDFLDLSLERPALDSAVESVSARSVGKGRHEIGADIAGRIESIVAPSVATLRSLIGTLQ